MSNQVDHPKHYNHIKGIECITVAEQLNFNLGNALKYIWRCEEKGNKIQDLKKALWYIEREIQNETAKIPVDKPGEILSEENYSREMCQHFVPRDLDCRSCRW